MLINSLGIKIYDKVYYEKNTNNQVYKLVYTADKISIEHVTIFPGKYISKGAVDMKFSPGACTMMVA